MRNAFFQNKSATNPCEYLFPGTGGFHFEDFAFLRVMMYYFTRGILECIDSLLDRFGIIIEAPE